MTIASLMVRIFEDANFFVGRSPSNICSFKAWLSKAFIGIGFLEVGFEMEKPIRVLEE